MKANDPLGAYNELMLAGGRLVEALRLERKSTGDPCYRTDEGLAQWRDQRRTVERLLEEYSEAFTRWRAVTRVEGATLSEIEPVLSTKMNAGF